MGGTTDSAVSRLLLPIHGLAGQKKKYDKKKSTHTQPQNKTKTRFFFSLFFFSIFHDLICFQIVPFACLRQQTKKNQI
jgi:hypothetical protein